VSTWGIKLLNTPKTRVRAVLWHGGKLRWSRKWAGAQNRRGGNRTRFASDCRLCSDESRPKSGRCGRPLLAASNWLRKQLHALAIAASVIPRGDFHHFQANVLVGGITGVMGSGGWECSRSQLPSLEIATPAHQICNFAGVFPRKIMPSFRESLRVIAGL